jgi:hypothetical protein
MVTCCIPKEKTVLYIFDTFKKQLDAIYTIDIDRVDWVYAIDTTSDDRTLFLALNDQSVMKIMLSFVPSQDRGENEVLR